MNRRDFLKAGVAASWLARGAHNLRATGKALPTLAKFVDPLPVPTALPHATSYHITMNQVMAKLHRDLPLTPVWAYNGNFLGTMIEAFRGTPISVKWDNQLPSTHLFPEAIDTTIHGSTPDIPPVKTVVHLHGAKVVPQFDGFPESWFTNATVNVNPPYYREYHYPNDQPATNLWFHDHAIGTTRLNVYAGLVGNYLLRDNVELALATSGLPMNGPYEIPLIIMDRWFAIGPNNKFTGAMLYDTPTTPPPGDFDASDATPHHPIWATELWADTALVNGKVFPYMNVEARMYRFRTLNACNSRFLNLSFHDDTADKDLPFTLIGTDQGFLVKPVRLTSVLKGNAERHDVLVDFTGLKGHTITLRNLQFGMSTAAPYPDGGGGPDLPQIMQFHVTDNPNGKIFNIPATIATPPSGPPPTIALTRDIAMDEIEDDETDEMRDPNFGPDPVPDEGPNESEAPVMGLLELKHWAEPTSSFPKLGTTEIWRFVNATPDTHPMHVHLVEFQVLDRQRFDVEKYKATRVVSFINPENNTPYPVLPPDPDEVNAPKDVVRASVGMVTRVQMTFNMPTGTVTTPGQHFKYVVHCHILEHEDNEMMRPFEVVA